MLATKRYPEVKRLPRGYKSSNHETIGADLLSLVDAILMPEQILGKELTQRLRMASPKGWYPVADVLDPLEQLNRKLSPDSLRRVGQTIFRNGPEAEFRRRVFSARDFFHSMDHLYHVANRGSDIGHWTVVSFDEDSAVLEKTTPHHCIMEEGIIAAGLRVLNVPAVIYQTSCFRAGAESCRFVVTSHLCSSRWSGQ